MGAGATDDRSFWGYGGIRLNSHWGTHWVVAPSFAIAAHEQGHGKNLGSPPVLGRFGIDVGYRLPDGVAIGVALHHMSNGKVLGQETNPGTEIVGVTVAFPLR